jgi:hypothetical protein
MGAKVNRPRKDYGSPLRIYADGEFSGTWTVLPPRSERAADRWRDIVGYWTAVFITGSSTSITGAMAGPHLGQRITWSDLPPAVQAMLRASFLSEYCPPVTDTRKDVEK